MCMTVNTLNGSMYAHLITGIEMDMGTEVSAVSLNNNKEDDIVIKRNESIDIRNSMTTGVHFSISLKIINIVKSFYDLNKKCC